MAWVRHERVKAHHVERNLELAWQVQEKVENLVENKENKGKSFNFYTTRRSVFEEININYYNVSQDRD